MKSLFKGIRKIILIVFVILVFLAGYVISDGYQMYKKVTEDVSIEEKVKEIQSKPSYVKIDDVSKEYLDAVVSIEDKRFRSHFGIDLYSIGRAFINNVENKKILGGGSTITQQLAKNMYFTQKKKLARKVAEVFVTLQLEEMYSKDEILELYINIIYFGDGYYGIKDASNGYLNKEPNELDLNEATLLAGIPNAPSVYQLSNNSKYTYQRQIIVIQSMVENNCLSKEEAQELIEKIKTYKNI